MVIHPVYFFTKLLDLFCTNIAFYFSMGILNQRLHKKTANSQVVVIFLIKNNTGNRV